MKRIKHLVACGIIALPLAVNAGDDLGARLIGTWVQPPGWVQPPWTNAIASSRPPRWLEITFLTNATVNWKWEIKEKPRNHTGVFKVQKKPVAREGMQQKYWVMIFTDTATFTTPLILDDVRVRQDNRFPADWIVLKFKCGEQESVVLVRKEDSLRTTGEP